MVAVMQRVVDDGTVAQPHMTVGVVTVEQRVCRRLHLNGVARVRADRASRVLLARRSGKK